MTTSRNVPVLAGAELRRGVSTEGDQDVSNLLRILPKQDYTALAQCRGQRYEDEFHHVNQWWVLLEAAPEWGWVSAVWVDEGGDNEAIAGVDEVPTVFDPPAFDGPAVPVHLVSGGAHLRRGGCAHSVPDNLVVPELLPGGTAHTYGAIAQCGGEDITDGNQHNFRWVLIETPRGTGWVSAVLVAEGGNGAPIPGVPPVPTTNSIPPGLLP